MSDDQLYGAEGIEAAHGNEPIYPSSPPEDILSEAEAVQKLSETNIRATPEERPIVERDLIKRRDGEPVQARNEDGTFAEGWYEREDPNRYVSAEEAARDLAATRQAEAKLLKDQEDLEVQRAVDALRAEGFQTGQQPAQPQEDPLKTWGDQQTATQQQPTNDDVRSQLANAIAQLGQGLATEADPQLRSYYETKKAELTQKLNEATWAKAFEQHPELVGMVEQEIANKVAERTAQVNAALQQQQAQVENARQLAVAALFSEPELQGISPDQLPGVLQYLQKNNPQRYEVIAQKVNKASAMVQSYALQQRQAQIAQAQQQQRQQQQQAAQFENYRQQQTALFEQRNPEFRDVETSAKASHQVKDYLKGRGLSDADFNAMWHMPIVHHHVFQEVLLDAIRYHEARAAIPKAKVAPVP